MPAVVISTDAARVDNTILLGYVTSEVALEEPEIGITDPNSPIENNCKDDEPHIGIPGGCEDYDDEGDEIDESDAIPTTSWRWWAANEIESSDLGTSMWTGMRPTLVAIRMWMRRKQHRKPIMD